MEDFPQRYYMKSREVLLLEQTGQELKERRERAQIYKPNIQ